MLYVKTRQDHPAAPLAIAAARYTQNPAKPTYAVLVAMCVNPGVYMDSPSFANNASSFDARCQSARIYSACLCGSPLAIMQIACLVLITSAAFLGHYACRIFEAGSDPSHHRLFIVRKLLVVLLQRSYGFMRSRSARSWQATPTLCVLVCLLAPPLRHSRHVCSRAGKPSATAHRFACSQIA